MVRAILSLSQAIFADKTPLSPAETALWQLCRALCFARPSARDPALDVDAARAAGIGPVACVLGGDDRFERDGVAAELVWELRARFATEAIAALADAGVVPLLCKGAAVAEAVYPQPWLRPMTDVDVLVSDGAMERAINALERIGYEQEGPAREQSSFHHAVTMRRESSAIDLHRSIVQPARDRGMSSALFDGSAESALFPGARCARPAALALAQLVFLARTELSAPALRLIELHWIASGLSYRERRELDGLAERFGMARPVDQVRSVVSGFANGRWQYSGLLPGPRELLRGGRTGRAKQLVRKIALAGSVADAVQHVVGAVRERIPGG